MNVSFKRLPVAVALALLLGACDDIPTVPTTTSTTTDLFIGSQLMIGGVTTRSFKVSKGGEVKVVFSSLLPDAGSAVSVSLGTFDGTNCTPTTTVVTVAGGTDPIIKTTLNAGDYCLRLADPGTLTKTNDFSTTVTIPSGS
jgi:hypothetical protein